MSDPNRFFEIPTASSDLKRTAVRGGTVTILGQAAKALLGVGATMVLARLLTPGDFGLIAMVAALTSFIAMFKDLGLSMATVQRAQISHDQISTLFWINVWVSAGLVVITAALAPAVAWFYGERRLVGVTVALAGVFLLGGLTVQHQALLRRQMRFTALAAIDVVAMVAGIVVAIAFAMTLPEKLGYWALVYRQVAMAAVTAAGVWLLCGWRPGRPARRSGTRPMLTFGGYLTGFNLVNSAARNLDNVLIGWRWHERQLGLYSKAYQLLLLPIQQLNTPVSSVAIPTLSRLQDDPERYRRYYCNAMNFLTYAATPVSVGMLALANEFIAVLLGSQWAGAARIFQILAIGAIGQPVSNATGWVFISLGRTRQMFYWGLMSVPVFIASFVIGLRWGAVGVAVGYATSSLLLRVPGWMYSFRGTPVRLSDLWAAIWRPLALSVGMLAIMLFVRHALLSWDIWPRLILTTAAGCASFAAAMLLWPAARQEGRRVWETAQMLRPAAGYDRPRS